MPILGECRIVKVNNPQLSPAKGCKIFSGVIFQIDNAITLSLSRDTALPSILKSFQ